MIKIIHGDLLSSSAKYICHQVNCQGVMGSGVAKQIRERWPVAFERYKIRCDGALDKKILLGSAQFVPVDDGRAVVNMFAQENYGRDGAVYTNHEAFMNACQAIERESGLGDTIAMPYRIGSGLGGGDWGVIMDILTTVFKDRHLTLYKKD